jgi:hypothetical protein
MVMAAAMVVCASGQAAEPVTLGIRVVDYTQRAGEALATAEHHVARVFGAAGITIVWREVPPTAAAAPDQVTVLILSEAMIEAKTAKDGIAPSVLGTAVPPPTRRAWIFFRRIEDAAFQQDQSPGLVLGHVIVHEVAHMVANIGHSEAGVMAAAFSPSLETFQGFTSEQGRELRAAVQTNGKSVVLDARARRRPFQLDGR